MRDLDNLLPKKPPADPLLETRYSPSK
jgi:hypothetical protein